MIFIRDIVKEDNMIEYREFRSERIEEIYQIYKENQWESYLKDKDKLARAFEQSLFVIGAFEDDHLVGFARCIGDNEYILYVQDLIIKPSHYRKGIGKELINRVSQKYSNVRQFVLITDKEDKVANAFYQAVGLVQECNGYPVNHYFRKRE